MDRMVKITQAATAEAVRAEVPADERDKTVTRALAQQGKEDALRLWLPLTMKALSDQPH